MNNVEKIKNSVDGIAINDEGLENRAAMDPFTTAKLLKNKYDNIIYEINLDTRDINVVISNIYSAYEVGIQTILFFSQELDFEDILDTISEFKTDFEDNIVRMCFGVSFDEIISDMSILNDMALAGFDFILLPQNYDPAIFIPFIQEAKNLDFQVFVKLSIFLNAQQVKFAKKYLNFGIPDELIAQMDNAKKPLEISIKFAKEYIEFLNILEINGLFLFIPQNEKNLAIKKALFHGED